MLKGFTPEKIYLATGYTDLRKGIDGLAGIVQEQFQLDAFSDALFLFCGRRNDRKIVSSPDGLLTFNTNTPFRREIGAII